MPWLDGEPEAYVLGQPSEADDEPVTTWSWGSGVRWTGVPGLGPLGGIGTWTTRDAVPAGV